MAFKQAVEKVVPGFPGKLVAPDAYFRVDKLEGNKTIMDCVLSAYYEGEIIFTARYPFIIDVNGENFIAQAYKHLRALPEYENAVDC